MGKKSDSGKGEVCWKGSVEEAEVTVQNENCDANTPAHAGPTRALQCHVCALTLLSSYTQPHTNT